MQDRKYRTRGTTRVLGCEISQTRSSSHTCDAPLVVNRSMILERGVEAQHEGEGVRLMANSHSCNARPHRNGTTVHDLGVHQAIDG